MLEKGRGSMGAQHEEASYRQEHMECFQAGLNLAHVLL